MSPHVDQYIVEHLVEVLRMYGNKRELEATFGPVMRAAADEIERLRRLTIGLSEQSGVEFRRRTDA